MSTLRSHPDASRRPLRVGLNLLFLGERAGGVGRYATELPGALLAVPLLAILKIFADRIEPLKNLGHLIGA